MKVQKVSLGLILIGVFFTGCSTMQQVSLNYTPTKEILEDETEIIFGQPVGYHEFGKAHIQGIVVTIKNNSNEVVVIKWSESCISTDGRSCIPFLEGMKYKDAGNPSATPDSIISPRGTLTKALYLSDGVRFYSSKYSSGWSLIGVYLNPGETMRFTLNIKIQKDNSPPKYYTIITPPITAYSEK